MSQIITNPRLRTPPLRGRNQRSTLGCSRSSGSPRTGQGGPDESALIKQACGIVFSVYRCIEDVSLLSALLTMIWRMRRDVREYISLLVRALEPIANDKANATAIYRLSVDHINQWSASLSFLSCACVFGYCLP